MAACWICRSVPCFFYLTDFGDYSTSARTDLLGSCFWHLYTVPFSRCALVYLACLFPFDGNLDCFQYFAISNKAAVNSLVHGSFHTCLYLQGFPRNGITGSKGMYILIFPVAKIMHICYTNFKQLWSSPHNPYPPSPSSASLFCALPPWLLACSSQSLPCLTDSGSPPPPTHPSPHLLLPLSLSRDFLICPQGLGWDLGSQSNIAFTTKPTKSRSLANVFKS